MRLRALQVVLTTIAIFVLFCLSGPWLVEQAKNEEKKSYEQNKIQTPTEERKPTVQPSPTVRPSVPPRREETSWASWYDQRNLLADYRLAICGKYMGVAHLELPLGTHVQLCSGGECVHVVVCDRGPKLTTGRDWDLSKEAFAELAPLELGVIEVKEKNGRK